MSAGPVASSAGTLITAPANTQAGSKDTGFRKMSHSPCVCCLSRVGPCGILRPQKLLDLKFFSTV